MRTVSSPSATSTSAGAPPSPSSGGLRSPPGSTPPNEPSPTLTLLSGTRQFGKPPRSSRRPTVRSRVADWHWEPVTDDLFDELPPAALAAVRQVAEELTVRESMIFLDGREFTGVEFSAAHVAVGPVPASDLGQVHDCVRGVTGMTMTICPIWKRGGA